MTLENLAGSTFQSPVEATTRAPRDTIRANKGTIERQMVLFRDQEHRVQASKDALVTPSTLPEGYGTSPEQPMHEAAVDGGEGRDLQCWQSTAESNEDYARNEARGRRIVFSGGCP